MIQRIVSGGQTGVDRAAHDTALGLGMPCGGWCPKGRIAEDGVIPDRYPLAETPSSGYEERTEWNVRDSDGTLILTDLPATGGTLFTIEAARDIGKPFLVVDLGDAERDTSAMAGWAVRVRTWLQAESIGILNVAGPRESKRPGVQTGVVDLLHLILAE